MMKSRMKLFAGLAALGLLCSALPVSAACTNGDVTGGGVSLADVSAILACNGTKASPPANPNPTVCNPLCSGAGILSCGDLNLDGAITTADAILLINEIPALGGGPGKNVVPICASPGSTVPCGTVIDAADPTNINSNRVLSSCEYFVKGTVFVQPGVVLTVRPGATIKGVAGASTVSALVFLPASNPAAAAPGTGCQTTTPAKFTARINAAGTPTQPIVFTSDQPVRHSGDWGGVAFNGCSRVNDLGGTSNAEGLVGVVFGGGTDCIANGGTANCTDSSGLMRYTRVEFAGNELSPDNELNVLTQNALGSNTKFTYLQAHMGLDDGFEWFGGTIREKHFVATANRDDNFDWQLGSDIKLQYGVAAQYIAQLDALGDNGFEGDNNERGFNNLALSTPQFCNVTIVGSKGQGTHPTGGSWFGALFRRGTAGQIAKTIITNMQTTGFRLRDPESAQHACLGVSTLRSDGVSAPTNAGNPGTCVGGTLNGSACNIDGDCTGGGKCLPYTLVSFATGQKVCASGASVGVNCLTNADCPVSTCGPNNLLIRNSLFYDNGTGGTVHAQVQSGGNNTGTRCNSSEWFALLQNDATLRVKGNTVAPPDATTNPGIQAGTAWPPVSFVPTNAANVADDPMSGGFDCGVGFGSFFDSTDYMGGIDPAGPDWTQTPGGWISYVTQ